jgi:hypothetical protein
MGTAYACQLNPRWYYPTPQSPPRKRGGEVLAQAKARVVLFPVRGLEYHWEAEPP